MIEKDDWRLLNDVEYLKNMYMNPADGEEIVGHTPYLKRCILCFDDHTNTIFQNMIDKIAMETGNHYMINNQIPPHVTIGAFFSIIQ